MRLGRFVLVMIVGTAIRTGALVFAGQQPGGDSEQIGRRLDPMSRTVLGVRMPRYLWRVLRYKHDHERAGRH